MLSRVPWLLFDTIARPMGSLLVRGHSGRANDADGRWRTIKYRPEGPEATAAFETVVHRAAGGILRHDQWLVPSDPYRIRRCPPEWVRDAWIAEGLCPHCLYPLRGEWLDDPRRGPVMPCSECGARWRPGRWLMPPRTSPPSDWNTRPVPRR